LQPNSRSLSPLSKAAGNDLTPPGFASAGVSRNTFGNSLSLSATNSLSMQGGRDSSRSCSKVTRSASDHFQLSDLSWAATWATNSWRDAQGPVDASALTESMKSAVDKAGTLSCLQKALDPVDTEDDNLTVDVGDSAGAIATAEPVNKELVLLEKNDRQPLNVPDVRTRALGNNDVATGKKSAGAKNRNAQLPSEDDGNGRHVLRRATGGGSSGSSSSLAGVSSQKIGRKRVASQELPALAHATASGTDAVAISSHIHISPPKPVRAAPPAASRPHIPKPAQAAEPLAKTPAPLQIERWDAAMSEEDGQQEAMPAVETATHLPGTNHQHIGLQRADMRPWEKDSKNRAGSMLKHLDFVSRGAQAASAVPSMRDVEAERCLFSHSKWEQTEKVKDAGRPKEPPFKRQAASLPHLSEDARQAPVQEQRRAQQSLPALHAKSTDHTSRQKKNNRRSAESSPNSPAPAPARAPDSKLHRPASASRAARRGSKRTQQSEALVQDSLETADVDHALPTPNAAQQAKALGERSEEAGNPSNVVNSISSKLPASAAAAYSHALKSQETRARPPPRISQPRLPVRHRSSPSPPPRAWRPSK